MRKGLSINEMINILKRSQSTIEKHRIAVLRKLRFSHTDALIRYCEKYAIETDHIDDIR